MKPLLIRIALTSISPLFLTTPVAALDLGQGRVLRVLDHQQIVISCDGGTERVKLRPNERLPRVTREEAQRTLEGLASFEWVALRSASQVQLRDRSGIKVVEAVRLTDGLSINDRLPAVDGDDEFIPGRFDYPVVHVIDFEHVVLKTNVGTVKVELAKVETSLDKVKHYEADKVATEILKNQFVQVRYDTDRPVKNHEGYYVVHLTTSHNKLPVNPRIPPVGGYSRRTPSADHIAGVNAMADRRRREAPARRAGRLSAILQLQGLDRAINATYGPGDSGYIGSGGGKIWIPSYTRKDGTPVTGHLRSAPSR